MPDTPAHHDVFGGRIGRTVQQSAPWWPPSTVPPGAPNVVFVVLDDTGFSHLAAAFGAPTIGIYCDHEPGLAGITGPGPVASFGGRGQQPGLDAVMAQLDIHLAGLV